MQTLHGATAAPAATTLPSTGSTLTAPARVFIIQPHMLMAKALGNVLQRDPFVNVVGDAVEANGMQLSKANPTLILLDGNISYEGLSNAIGMCRLACPRARIGVLSEHLSSEAMQRVLSAGADGYIIKDITPDELLVAVKSMAGGNLYVDPRLVGLILRKHAGIGRRDPNELSPRESDIVRLIAAGLSNREISDRLSLSDKTVKNHISHIFAKLNVTARTQVVIYAMRNGLA